MPLDGQKLLADLRRLVEEAERDAATPADPPVVVDPPVVDHPVEPEPTFDVMLDLDLSRDRTIGYAPDGPEPITVEWNGLPPLRVIGGAAVLVGNSTTSRHSGYHRIMSTQPIHDPTKVLDIQTTVEVTRAYAVSFQGLYTGWKPGVKYPKPKAQNGGHDLTNMRSVVGGRSGANPYSWIGVCGLGPEGRLEVARYDGSDYLRFPPARKLGSTVGKEMDVMVRLDPRDPERWEWTIWHSHDESSEPVYMFAGPPPAKASLLAPGFLWLRADQVDGKMKKLRVIQHR